MSTIDLPNQETKQPGAVAHWLRHAETLSSSVYVWWTVCLFWAGIYAWVDRYSMNPDGMSYLDMACESLKYGPSNLVNGYWSPLYPTLISLTISILRPSSALAFPVLHLTNFLIFSVALACFTFFLRSWFAIQQDGAATEHSGMPHLIPFCFCVFLWFTMEFVRPSFETPDLCVTAMVFLAAGICCRLCLPGSRWRYFLALGTVLGVAYYAKAVMFPVGLILLGVLLMLPPSGKHTRLKVAFAGLVFVIVAAPLVALVSKRVGHLSIGETGPINYALYVNGLPGPPSWLPGSANGTPEHPARTILIKPLIIEFAAPVKGTNPLGYDPSYWFSGGRVRFDLRQQWAAVKTNLRLYLGYCSGMVGIFSGALILCIFNVRRNPLHRPDNRSWWFILWPVATCGMYALVHVEARFLPGFLILFWLAVYGLLWQRVDQLARAAVLGTVFFVLLVPAAVNLLKATAHTMRGVVDRPDYVLVGEALRAVGIGRGDSLAAAGGFDYETGGRVYRASSAWTAYYARYVGARVIAAIVDADDGKDMPQRQAPEFWHVSAEDLVRAKEVLAGIGVKAIVALDRPADSTPADWQQVIGTRYSILLVKASDSAK